MQFQAEARRSLAHQEAKMAAPGHQYSFDLEVIRKSAENWRREKAKREKKQQLINKKRYDQVESMERLAKRANRLLNNVKVATQSAEQISLSEELRTLVERPPLEVDEINNKLMERVIGETRDFLSVNFLMQGLQASRSVGRVVRKLGGGRVSYGTGFMVSPHLMLTNNHVLATAAQAAESMIEFDYQIDPSGTTLAVQQFNLAPEAFFFTSREFDFALVAVKEVSKKGKPLKDYGWLPLIPQEGKGIIGDSLNIIQHPKGEMKQIVIRENRLLDLLNNFAHYKGDTEPGSSGSPVFNDEWEVIALHHSGVPKTNKNGKFLDIDGNIWNPGDDPELLAWEANEGIRVSRLVGRIATARIREHEKPLRDELLDPKMHIQPAFIAPELGRGIRGEFNTPGVAPVELTMPSEMGEPVTITVPLNIMVRFGVPPQIVLTAESKPTPISEILESIQPDPDYKSRLGYNPNFLGFKVLLPKLGSAILSQALDVSNGQNSKKHELKYYHYSVIMNRERRIAFVAAVNYDANAPFKHKREGGDKWFFDPRIKEDFQAGEIFYEGNPLDRGHLVRRADGAWGLTEQEAKLANDDTFHFTNCTPQHEIFNRSSKATEKGLLLWGNIENHLAKQAEKNNQKLCIFNGPIFRSTDKPHRGLPIPTEFWKVVVFKKDNGNPAAIAFLFSQEALIKNLPREEFIVGDYQPFQVKLRDIEKRTNLNFGNLKKLDPLEMPGNESFFESDLQLFTLTDTADIIV
jgi:endonuclease G, mitochondrial